MIDLSSKDCSYTSLKVNQIKRLLKEINADVSELTSSDIVNIALITFAYLCEGDFIESDDDGLTIDLYEDVLLIDVEDVTMQLKFKNALVNKLLEQKEASELLKDCKILRELVEGDENGF